MYVCTCIYCMCLYNLPCEIMDIEACLCTLCWPCAHVCSVCVTVCLATPCVRVLPPPARTNNWHSQCFTPILRGLSTVFFFSGVLYWVKFLRAEFDGDSKLGYLSLSLPPVSGRCLAGCRLAPKPVNLLAYGRYRLSILFCV